ncbi:MAG: twin-arginine translocase subunit TatC, partial [Deltaproteobacteria bacterium]|nr:twin-arginine translocase subunit TatC [Deltaproteobacteria bacterium]
MAEPEIKDPNKMTLLQHLEELRRRLIKSVVVIFIAVVACFSMAPNLFDILRTPLDHIVEGNDIELQVLGPLEMFVTYLKLSLLAALFVTAPWVLLQVWMFVAPGLYKHEKRWIVPFVVLGSVFFAGGAAFAFEIVLPMGFDYLVQMTPDIVKTEWSVEKY